MFILVKRDGKPVACINTQDLKTIDIDLKNKVTVSLSVDSVDMEMTQYAIDKLRKEIRDRYNIVKIGSNGVHSSGDHERNDIYEITHDRGLTIVFPKSLRSLRVQDRVATISVPGHENGDNRDIEVKLAHDLDFSRIKLFNCALEES